MATDFGADIACLTDLPDPEALVSGNLAVAYAVARRWLTQDGALAEIGDPTPYACFDLRDYLGARSTPTTERDIERLCITAANEDPRVAFIAVTVALAAGALTVSAKMTTALGPFDFVLSVTAVTAALMLG